MRRLLVFLLTVALSLGALAGCEQAKQLGARVESALTAADALIAALPEETPGRAEYQRLRASLAAFQEAVPKAQTPEQKLALLVQFTALVAEFNSVARPVVPPESDAGKALARLDSTLKGLARKLSCLLAESRQQLKGLTPEQNAAAQRAYNELAAFAE